MNIIFLDFDEVMTNIIDRKIEFQRSVLPYRQSKPNLFNPNLSHNLENIDDLIALKALEIDSESMRLLDFAVAAIDAKVVISSKWREIRPFYDDDKKVTIERFKKLFEKKGFPDFPIIDITPQFIHHRGYEIATYLDSVTTRADNPITVDKYLILDDGFDFFTEDLNTLTEDELKETYLFSNNKEKPIFKSHNDIKDKSHFWHNQPLLKIDPIYGFDKRDCAKVIQYFNPEHSLSKELSSRTKYTETYKLYNGDLESKTSNRNTFKR